ncbi:MAG: histidine kinase, partial [Salibacteraceae bacterium]
MQALNAQRYYFIPYSVNEGLAQSQVRDIVQSKDGFLWIATVGGISRFDGNSFRTYNKSNGLLNNLTNALFQGENGEMIASCVGGIAIFDQEKLNQFVFEPPYENTLVNDFLNFEDQLILGSNGNGLLFYKNDSIIKQIDLGSKNRNFIRCLWNTQNGILAGTKEGLVLIKPDGEVDLLNDEISVNSITGTSTEQWIATNGSGLLRYKDGNLDVFGKEEGLINLFVRDVTVDQEGNPWLISKNSIQRLNRTDLSFDEIKSFEPEVTSNMKVIYVDGENNLWIGTDGYGVLKFTGEQFRIFGTDDGLSSNIIMDIDQEANGDYILATYGYGVIRMGDDGIDTINNREGLTNLTVWSILPLEDETWLGTSDGIQILKSNEVLPFEGNKALPFPRISNLFEDSKGRKWIASRNGACFWNGHEIVIPEAINELSPKDVKGFVETDEAIWFTSNQGLVKYGNDGTATRFNKSNGFPEDYLTCITKINGSELWVGSEEGVIQFSTETEKAILHSVSDKISSNVINFIANESDKRLWFGTDNGVFQLNVEEYKKTQQFTPRGYNKHDGVISNECNQNAVFIDSEENVWFGTNGGLIQYQYKRDSKEQFEVIGISLTDIQENFESAFSQIHIDTFNHEANTFDYDQNRLTFRYAAIHFTNPDKVYFSYRLLGLDDEWSPDTKENYITYSNLAPGNYTFQVKAKVNGGDWIDQPEAFNFYIAPPFWMRWWFITLCILTIAAIGLLVYKQIISQQKRKRALANMQNKARILGLEQQTLNAHMNRHFIFNALNSIQYYINTQDRIQANQYLTNFASLVRKNLDSAQSESIFLKDEIERLKLYINLEQMRFKDRFSFEVKVDKLLDTDAIQVPSMILQPFVENSIMHGILPSDEFGKINITISEENGSLLFTIDDNGIGIETSVKQKEATSHHVSNGMKITKQRIELLAKAMNSAYGVYGPYELKDESGSTIGTRVRIVL